MSAESEDNSRRVIDQGKCGKEVQFTYYSDGTMEIYGSGDMTDYDFDIIGDRFYNATPWKVYPNDIKHVSIGEGVTSIGSCSFTMCKSLESVSIPGSVKWIGFLAFSDCSSLKEITIPGSVIDIGTKAFWGCTGLVKVVIPDSVMKIGEAAFFANNLERFTGTYPGITDDGFMLLSPDGKTAIACAERTLREEIVIPDSVRSVLGYAFCLCKNTRSVKFPPEIRHIGDKAFLHCSLGTVNLPKGVDMGKSVFDENVDIAWE
ncbi:MAG: leucine-rich repeat domain-containing protein [archaeon]|nr:leucine-rich repeat domain-containing protein [archaeon]